MVPKWLGPYEIVSLTDKIVQLQNLKTKTIMANHVNVDRLKLYKEASTQSNKKRCYEDTCSAILLKNESTLK